MDMVRNTPQYLTKISAINELSDSEKRELSAVTDKFVFRTNDYYQSLINWNDPDDPIRRIVMPQAQELEGYGKWDASDEASYTVTRGVEHKYSDTALLLVNNVCGAYCRFCFRKRLFTHGNDEAANDITEAVRYIREHPEITNIVLSGGDPLIMSTGKLEGILEQLASIDHVRIIRIGSKLPAFNPFRIINDPSLLEMLRHYTSREKRIYLMAHFNHPRELTDEAALGLLLMQQAGATAFNQTPIIAGVNDSADVLAELFAKLSFLGVTPYYLFICRPTIGNKIFVVPIEEALSIFDQAKRKLAGVAKTARLCMSHSSGKIEVVGRSGDHIIFRRHRSPSFSDPEDLLIFPSNPAACWFDDYINAHHAPEPALVMQEAEGALPAR